MTQILVKTEEFVGMELTATLVVVFLDTREIIAKLVSLVLPHRFETYGIIFANIYS